MRRLTFWVVLGSLWSSLCWANLEQEGLFARAGQSYDAEDYRLASAQYDSLLQAGTRAPEVYFNLGNSHFRSGSLGHAIWAYRSALELAPRDRDIVANLTVARLACRDKIEPIPPSFIQEVWRAASGLLSLSEGAYLVTVLWLALWLLVAAALFWPRVRRWILPAARFLAFVWLVSAAILAVRYLAIRQTQAGVVTAQETQARSAPHADEDVVFTGHAGLECMVRGNREDFVLIELTNGRVGWIPASDLRLIRP